MPEEQNEQTLIENVDSSRMIEQITYIGDVPCVMIPHTVAYNKRKIVS